MRAMFNNVNVIVEFTDKKKNRMGVNFCRQSLTLDLNLCKIYAFPVIWTWVWFLILKIFSHKNYKFWTFMSILLFEL